MVEVYVRSMKRKKKLIWQVEEATCALGGCLSPQDHVCKVVVKIGREKILYTSMSIHPQEQVKEKTCFERSQA